MDRVRDSIIFPLETHWLDSAVRLSLCSQVVAFEEKGSSNLGGQTWQLEWRSQGCFAREITNWQEIELSGKRCLISAKPCWHVASYKMPPPGVQALCILNASHLCFIAFPWQWSRLKQQQHSNWQRHWVKGTCASSMCWGVRVKTSDEYMNSKASREMEKKYLVRLNSLTFTWHCCFPTQRSFVAILGVALHC